MKTFLKITLLVLAALVAIKLLPFTFFLGCLLALAVAGLALAGVSLIAGVFVAALVLGAILAPVWIPVLVIVGLIALIKRCSRHPVAA